MYSLFIFSILINLLQTDAVNTYINGACVDCQSGTLVPSGGSSAAAPVIRQLGFSFQLVEPTIQVDFTSESLDSAMNHLQAACRKTYQYDFAALDYPLSAWAADTPLLSTDLQSVPVVAYANVVTYNLPGLVTNVDPNLILSRQNIYDIMYGSLTTWSDARLIATNPLLADRLPNETITLVLRSDPNGAAGDVMTMLQNMQGSNTTFFTQWPKQFLSMSDRLLVQGAIGVIAAITSNSYTLGFVPQPYTDEAGLPNANLENRDGYIVQAGEDIGVYHAIETAYGSNNTLNPADQHGVDAYPFAQMVHLVYHTDVNSQCDSRIAMAKFILWMLTNPNALAQIYANPGFISLPTALVNQVIATIGHLQCDNQLLLQTTFQDYGNDALTQTITIFAAVLMVLALSVLSTLSYKRHNRITRAAGLAFAFFFLLGCVFNYLSVIFWATIPSNTSICIGRYAFVTIGYSLILGAMFAKCWEISKIFYRAEQGDISPFKELPWWMFCRAFFAVVFFEVLFLFLWLMIDPPVSTVVIIDEVNLFAVHQCTTQHPAVWYSLHFVYFGVVLFWGAYLAYLTRDIWQKYNYPNESRSILLSIYNLGFCSVILVPLVTALDTSPEVLFFLISVAILFPTTFALVIVHGPKMLAFLATSISKGSKGSKNGGTDRHAKEVPTSRAESHTLRILKVTEDNKDKERDRSLVEDASGRIPETPMKGIKSLEDPLATTTVPPLGSTWKVLTPATAVRADSPSAFDTPEVTNPLFGENV